MSELRDLRSTGAIRATVETPRPALAVIAPLHTSWLAGIVTRGGLPHRAPGSEADGAQAVLAAAPIAGEWSVEFGAGGYVALYRYDGRENVSGMNREAKFDRNSEKKR